MDLNEKLLALQTIIESVKETIGKCDTEEKIEILNSVINNAMKQIGLNEEREQQVVQEGDIVTIIFSEFMDYYNYKICPGITRLEQNRLLYEDFGMTFAIHWMSALGLSIVGAKVGDVLEVELRESDCKDLKELYPDIVPGMYHIKIAKIEKTKDSKDVKDPILDYEMQQHECYISPEEHARLISSAKIACKLRMENQIKFYEENIDAMHMDTIEAKYARTRARHNRAIRFREAGHDLRPYTSSSSYYE